MSGRSGQPFRFSSPIISAILRSASTTARGMLPAPRWPPPPYRAAISPDDVSTPFLDLLLERVTGPVPLVAHLVQDPSLTPEDLDEMQRLIDANDGGFKLRPWDWWFYAEKLRKQKSGRTTADDDYRYPDNLLRCFSTRSLGHLNLTVAAV